MALKPLSWLKAITQAAIQVVVLAWVLERARFTSIESYASAGSQERTTKKFPPYLEKRVTITMGLADCCCTIEYDAT